MSTSRAVAAGGALAALCLLSSCGGAAPAQIAGPAPTSSPTTSAVPRSPILWGAYAGGAQYGWADAPWDLSSAAALQLQAGKRMSMLEWGQDWYETGANSGGLSLQQFPAELAEAVRRAGYLPVISWGSSQAGSSGPQPELRLARITGGAYDDYLRAWAQAAAAWGHTLYLRFDWEMNFPSPPYSERGNGNHPGDFVAMWRHVHDVFVDAGAANVKWVWCPQANTSSSEPLAGLYPGDGYVDWACLDGYNWGTTNVGDTGGWKSFDQIFGATLGQLERLAPGKPVMIGEMAATERGGSKAAWITETFSAIADRYPTIGAVIWFNKSADGMDWPVESSATAQAAFAAAIAAPRYAGGP